MSYFSDASLVFIPSAQKSGKAYSIKPTDGTGDLTFTRSNDTATRVASNGLIERVRTNLILQSQAFNVTWTPVRSSVTVNTTTAPDGTSTADTLFDSVDNNIHYVRQSFTAITGPATISIYAKANQLSQIQLVAAGGTTPMGRGFDLSTGTTFVESIGGVISNDLGQSITAVGNGWYRCTMSWTSTGQNDFWILTSSSNFATYAGTGTDGVYIWGAQLETGDIATQPILTTTAAVSVGPVANVPRLDYLNSSCPRLLLEGQRVNLCVHSENLDNAVWTKVNTTVTANNTTAPDGYLGADRINEDTANSAHAVERVTTASAGTYTFSIFIKKGTRRYAGMRAVVNGYTNRYFSLLDLDTGLIVSNNTVGTGVTWTSSVENYGNGWYRLIITGNHTASNITLLAALSDSATPTYLSGAPSYQGIASENGYFWGAQIEAGAYATSYIPTLASASTRGADSCSKTGISSLIGQTEGVLFVDFVPNNTPASGVQQWLFFLGSGSAYIAIFISSGQKLRANVANTTDQAVIDTSFNLVAGTRYKAALAYKENDFAFYVNGVQIGIDTSGTVPAVSSLQNNYNTTAANSSNAGLNQALLFKTRLTNAQLAELTTI